MAISNSVKSSITSKDLTYFKLYRYVPHFSLTMRSNFVIIWKPSKVKIPLLKTFKYSLC